MPFTRGLPVQRLVAFGWGCLLAIHQDVSGLGIRIADQDPLATARGNAFVATADNPSAIYYNPAGLTQLKGRQVRAGVYGIQLKSEFTSPAGAKVETKDRPQGVPQFFYGERLTDLPLAWGLGVYSPYGLGIEWPEGAPFRAMFGRIAYFSINPAVAWEVLPGLSLGAGATFNYAETDLRQMIFPGGPAAGLRNHFTGDDWDLGFNAGLLWRVNEQHSLGVNYRHATTIKFNGTSENAGFGAPASSPASVSFPFPRNLVLGWSWRPTPRWNVEFNADWTEWDRVGTLVLQQGAAVGGPTAFPFNWTSSWFYEWGVTRAFDGGWRVSGGYIFSENSVPDATFNPLVPDSDRHIFSLGTGRTQGRWNWDVAYQLAWGPGRTVAGNALVFPVGATANGRFTFLSHALTLSAGYEF